MVVHYGRQRSRRDASSVSPVPPGHGAPGRRAAVRPGCPRADRAGDRAGRAARAIGLRGLARVTAPRALYPSDMLRSEMPTYRFDIRNGRTMRDPHGIDLPNDDMVRYGERIAQSLGPISGRIRLL